MTKLEAMMTKTTTGISAVGVTLPAWWPTLEGASNVAVLLVPILSALWLLVQIVTFARKNWQAYHRADDGFVGRRGVFGIMAAASLAAAVPVVSQFEGRSLNAYRDVVGVATICDGVTLGVRMGDTATNAECDQLLARELRTHAAGLSACIADDVEKAIPRDTAVALISWTYNVGVTAACGSTLVRKLNAGDLVGACAQLPRWNRAGGRVVRGLTNRRAAEFDLCIGAL
ncbi:MULTISPECIES: lysozyme [Pacificibacter]|uniref:lysozyme n=1 Tax=Pacificibacter TaxID=1042323 RepID=UPI001C087F47|nr:MULTISPECIES: lysozyme [Pacificibacter]MBU2936974.1 lysozyme [Pacificibacter marinus]MDO6617150.1 lysozyme [Pacificibacter sp. 1_MG-2023]